MKSVVVTVLLGAVACLTSGKAQVVDTVINSGLHEPHSLAVIGDNLYITDNANDRVVRFIPDTGVLTNFAGLLGTPGTNNGTGTFARFADPRGIVAARGGLVVADTGNHQLRFISLGGTVSNLAGVAESPGLLDGPAAQAMFRNPIGLAADTNGNIFIADSQNNAIRKLDTNNVVTTLASAFLAANPSLAFFQPNAVAVGQNGEIIVADTRKHSIKIIDTNDTVRVLAGSNNSQLFGVEDSLFATSALFNQPRGLLWLDNPALGVLVSDTANHTIRRIFFNADVNDYSVETFAGMPGILGLTNGVALAANFYSPIGISRDPTTGFLIVDQQNNAVRRIQTGPPLPRVGNPQIGWVDFVEDDFGRLVSRLVPVTQSTFNNDVIIAILPAEIGIETYFTSGPTPPNALQDTIPSPGRSTGQSPVPYQNGLSPDEVGPTLLPVQPDLTIKSISSHDTRRASDVVQARFQFKVANPIIDGDNPASFNVRNITTDAQMFYTIDGTDPTNNLATTSIGPIFSGAKISLLINTNVLFKVRAFRNNYQPSTIVSNLFTTTNFVANRISFGFEGGEASSEYVAAAGQRFVAPVTLSLLPTAKIYSLQFNLTVTNTVGNPVTPGDLGFNSMLLRRVGTTDPPEFKVIPPGFFTNGPNTFLTLLNTNASQNLLTVGWLERFGNVDLYNSFNQDLVTFSQAHNNRFSSTGGKVILGGFHFQVPTNAVTGDAYRIQIGRPSATEDGIAADVFIQAPTNGTTGAGTINAIKDVTIGERRYIVGDSAPFRWFNAGDFGDTNLLNNDVMEVFIAALNFAAVTNITSLPPGLPPPGSDFFDAMDSSNGMTNGFDIATTNNVTLDSIQFGDGSLNVDDVYVTFRRSLDPALKWYARFWSNGMRQVVEVTNRFRGGFASMPAESMTSAPRAAASASATSGATPLVRFSAGVVRAESALSVNVPIRAEVLGDFPARVLMMNLSVVPVGNSPPIEVPLQFTADPSWGQPNINLSSTPGAYAAAWLNDSTAGQLGAGVIGTLHVPLPVSVDATSAYEVQFQHVSASPNGLALFPKEIENGAIAVGTGVISTWGDGIPDSWRIQYFGSASKQILEAAAGADPDEDGLTNRAEFVAGTDPRSNASRLYLTAHAEPNAVLLRWPSIAGKRYQLEGSPTLDSPAWIVITSGTATGAIMEFRHTNQNIHFYRLRVLE
ncbi:MAG: hypothetical protein AB1813_09070 [Verrucomicrobiota bacterium]